MNLVTTAPRPAVDPEAAADRLRLATTRLARVLRQETHTGLTPTQLAALATIERGGPMPIGALAGTERISAPTATKAVEKLVRAGLVERHGDPDDRRVTLVDVTAAGRRLLDEARQHKTAWLATRLAELPARDQARLAEVLEVLERLVDASPTAAQRREGQS